MIPRQFWDYICHQLTAKNRHGIHSPFVYKLLDQIVYDKSDKKEYTELKNLTKNLSADRRRTNSTKVNELIFRLVKYFDAGHIIIGDHVNRATKAYIHMAGEDTQMVNRDKEIADLMIIDIRDIGVGFTKTRPNSIIIITNIYQDRPYWEQLKMNDNVTVTINFFWIGLLFFRPGQVKEDFELKI